MSDLSLALLGLAVGSMLLMGLVLTPTRAGHVQTGTHGGGVLSAARLYAIGTLVIGAWALANLLLGTP
jgi:hypothetical protein